MSGTVYERVAAFFARTSMANAGEKIGVAVSGGADSVFLLEILLALRAQLGYSLAVLHVNHQLRGAESQADERFVADLAAARGLPFFTRAAPLSAVAGNNEQQARALRRAFFARLRSEQAVSRVALGHTMSDQAETVLLRLFRGAGLKGLAGMRPVTPDGLIRPLLELSREQVRAEALALGLRWREDSSNQDRRFRRNLLRLDVLPQLRDAFHPRIESVLAGVARVAQAEEDYWDGQVAALYPRIAADTPHGLMIDVPTFAPLHPAVQRRLLRAALLHVKADLLCIDSAHVDAIAALCARLDGHDRVQVPGVDALRSFDRLRLARWPPPDAGTGRLPYQVALPLGQRVQLPFGSGQVLAEHVPTTSSESPAPGVEQAHFDRDAWSAAAQRGEVMVRNWRPGDAYCPHGRSAPAKIKTLFQEQRVYLWERKHWPVMEISGTIGWARAFGPEVRLAAQPRSAGVVRLTYYR